MSSVERLKRRIAEAFYGRFKSLHPHQEEAIDNILDGKNVILSAGTGSGKTEAVMAPLVNCYMTEAVNANTPTIIYIAPTKALVNDIYKRLDLPLQYIGLRVGVRHGDKDSLKQKDTPHVLVTTPESLDVLLFRKDVALRTVRAVVIDEVHLFYNTQRGLQLSILLHRMEQLNGSEIQFACLSATVVSLPYIRDFLFGNERNCEFIKASTKRHINSIVRILNSSKELVQLISKQIGPPNTKLLIFANTRKECERIATLLRGEKILQDGVFPHYSSLSDTVRTRVEHDFSALSSAICISTSTLELGIDIGDIDMVILYGAPSNVESLLQRIGRSNRKSTVTQVACLVPETSTKPTEEALRFATLINLAETGTLPATEPYRLYGPIAQQSLSIIGSLDGSYTRIADIASTTEHLQHLDRSVIESILAELGTAGYLRPHGFKYRYGGAERLYQLIDYRLIYGNFPVSSREIPINNGGLTLGYVPIDNILRLRRGDTIQFAGKLWHIQKLTTEEICVVPTESSRTPSDIIYSGAGNRPSEFIVSELWRLLHSSDDMLKNTSGMTRIRIEKIIHDIQCVCRYDQIPVIDDLDFRTRTYMTFGGISVNTAIGLLSDCSSFTANEFAIVLPKHVDWHVSTNKDEFERIIPDLYRKIKNDLEETIYQKMLPDDLRFQEQMQFWYYDMTIDSILRRLAGSSLQITSSEPFVAFIK
jgi:ATP-dependent helicase Lhr and Lhr-like helicase